MKELLTQYAAYNIWANNRIIDAMFELPAGAIDLEMLSSFKTIRETVIHTWSAENMWLQRLNNEPEPVWMAKSFDGSFEEACDNWRDDSHGIAEYVGACSEAKFKEDLHYADLRGNEHTTPVFMVLQHVFNHATYHRGQLVTMMRTAGETKIPGTDFIGFVRELKQQ
jgi:uncharacterized damage-inducible protein DinB